MGGEVILPSSGDEEMWTGPQIKY